MPSGDGARSGPSLGATAHDEAARLFGVGDQHLDHLIDRDVVVVGMPAIVIRHHRDDGVGQFRLAGELGFRHGRHADHAAAPGAVQIRFRERGKLRTFHREIGAALRVRNAFFRARRAARRRASDRPDARARHAPRNRGRRNFSRAHACGR